MPSIDRALRRHVESIGRAPGSVVVPEGSPPPKIHLTLYDRDRHEKRKDVTPESLVDLDLEGRIAWVDVNGLGDQTVLEKLVKTFDLPWLAMEDVLHSPQRPKVDEYGDARFIVMRMFDRPGYCETDQFSIFIRGNVVVTFQERPGDPFDAMRRRLEDAKSQLRLRGADYLVYRMIDACVDSAFPEMQRLSDAVEAIENRAIDRPSGRLIRDLHEVRRELRILERLALATRDTVGALLRDEESFFDHATRPYLHDVHDHASQIVDLSHYYTSVANDIGAFIIGTLDLRMNQVMRVLAAVTVVLMPVTLIAGVYGMNFKYMPELEWKYGYLFALGLMFAVAAGLTLWLRRRGWMKSDAD